MKRLTLKQIRYCQWFVLCFADGSQSAKNAGYKSYPRQQSYRLHHTLSVRIFFQWQTELDMHGNYIPWIDNAILKKRLRLYGYTVNDRLLTYAVKTAPTISYKDLHDKLQTFFKD